MANHVTIENTDKPMNQESIKKVLDLVNTKYLFGLAKIEDSYYDGYALYFEDVPHDSRQCWLNNEHEFELRHGGVGFFQFWIDRLICYEIIQAFGGKWHEDCSGYLDVEKPNPNFTLAQRDRILTPINDKDDYVPTFYDAVKIYKFRYLGVSKQYLKLAKQERQRGSRR